MPKVLAQGKTIECVDKANLHQILVQNGIDLYNGNAKVINCRGIGSCGTCAVQIEGEVSQASWRDRTRLFFTSPFSYTKPGLQQSNKGVRRCESHKI
jgi:ferredoxin